MGLLKKLFGGKERHAQEVYEITSSRGVLKLWLEQDLQQDPDPKLEEYWIETLDVSEDARWLLVGRRYGLFQFYDWRGKLHRLPARPPAQVVSEILFKENFLVLITPPYLVVYRIEDPEKPVSWKSFKLSQEGMRPSMGLDLMHGVLAFGAVGNRIYAIDVGQDLSLQRVEFKSSFSVVDVGELKSIKFLTPSKLFISGTEGSAIYSLSGNLLKKFPYRAGRAVALLSGKLILGEESKVIVLDAQKEEELHRLDIPLRVSQLDGDPEGFFVFLADAEGNHFGLLDLQTPQYLQTLEGFGYSVVKVSRDGSIYTSRWIEEKDRKLYQLVKLGSNLVDFIYPKDRQEKVLKQAEKAYREFISKVQKAKDLSQLENLNSLKEMAPLDTPLRKVRQLYFEAEELLRKKRLALFLEYIREKIQRGEASQKELKEIDEWLRDAQEEESEKLSKAKEELERELKNRLIRALEDLRIALEGRESQDLEQLEAMEEVKNFREFLSKLPRELSREGEQSVQRLLQEKVISYRLRRFRIESSEDRIFFGREDFPRFSGERRKLSWRLKVEERIPLNGEIYAKIAFEREDGILLEPKRYSNLLPIRELRRMPKWVRSYLRHLKGLFSYEPYRLPLFVSYEETPWFVYNLERFVSMVKDQLSFGEGILILEGDAGVGKNFLVEVFSALTNRPLYIIPCHSKMEKEDLTYTYEFDPKKGTKKVFSDLIKALQTPGAVIYLDEINTLPPALVKLFNPLFDYRRYLVMPTGEVIKARRDVILVGGMNPQHYLGVSELPQDIKSRADVMFVDYPPFEDSRGFFHPDEALILKDYISSLSELSNEKFVYLWYALINRVETPQAQRLINPTREEHINLLFELLKIANRIRKAYRDYQSQRSEEPVEFVFSIRDTIRCARRLERYNSAQTVVVETILPKVSSPLEREILRNIIESA